MDLSKWNPFKFVRRRAAEKKAEQAHRTQQLVHPPPAPSHQDALQRMMHQFFQGPLTSSVTMPSAALDTHRWFGDFSPVVFQPCVDVVDEETALRVTAELPGLDDEDVTLTIDAGTLTITGEKRIDATRDEDGCFRTERAYGFFQRVVPLPSDVERDGAEASFQKGVLTVRIPKRKSAQRTAKKIPIKSRPHSSD